MSGGFVPDPRLAGSSVFVTDWDLCRVSLKNDKTWPWLYLVPRRENIREIFELSQAEQQLLIREISRAGAVLQNLYNPDKINTAALGNMVPQLHVHVFARFKTDAAWPGAVWSVQANEIPYTESEAEAEIKRLKEGFDRTAS